MLQMPSTSLLPTALHRPRSCAQDNNAGESRSDKTISLERCVVRNEKTPEQFTLEDANEASVTGSPSQAAGLVAGRVSNRGSGGRGSKRLNRSKRLLPIPNVGRRSVRPWTGGPVCRLRMINRRWPGNIYFLNSQVRTSAGHR